MDFFLPIRNEYLRNSRIQRMINEEKTFPIEHSYINLVIVETKEQQEKEKKFRQSEHNDAIISTFEDVYGNKTSIDIKDVFEKCKDQTKKVLVLGRAGIGKSTFCRYVSYQWAKTEIWPQYQLVVLIRLRLLTSIRYPPGPEYSPIDLVKREYFPYHTIPDKNKERFEELCSTGQVLWLLDGYDEFVQNNPEHLKDLFDHLLKTQHHILTSRPYSFTLSYDVKMEIIGFRDDNILKYVEQFFDQIKDQVDDTSAEVQKLLSFLKTNPGIWGVAHIPVNLEMICSLWVDIDSSETNIFTVTALYDNMTEWLCRRYLTKQNIDNVNMEKKTVYTYCQKELAFLESLAFHGMKDNCIILRPNLLEKTETKIDYSLDDHPELLKIGILHSMNDRLIGSHIQSQIDYHFVHLSFQEHFAARYLVNALSSPSPHEAIQFIKTNKYDQRFTLILTFVSGLLTVQNSKPALDTFWKTLLAEPLDLVGFRHIQLIISCLEEVTEGTELRCRTELIDSIIKWIKYVSSTRSETLRTQFTNSLKRNAFLVREPAITNQLTELMNSSEPHVQSYIYRLIEKLWAHNPQHECIVTPTDALGSDREDVRRSGSDVFGNMGGETAISEIISKLVTLLEDEDWMVRDSACISLGKMGEKAATCEAISKLANALEDDDEVVRSSASKALGKMGEKVATCEAISKLLNALEDDDEVVRSSASKALGKMGEKVATREAISKLVNALEDDDANVRDSACYALGNMGEKAATSEVISKLGDALGDNDDDVRNTASEALSKIGGIAATSEVISELVNALGDDDANVRSSTSRALGNMGEKAATSEVISKLLNALKDDDGKVRYRACYALGKMGEKAATSEVISKLVNALEDDDWHARHWACYALGNMGEKAATSEVISKLVNAVGDDDANVRNSTCAALGNMGEKVATSEVISRVVNALEDDEDDNMYKASEALSKMSEKAATSEVINKMLELLENGERIDDDLTKILQKLFTSFTMMSALNSDTIRKLLACLDRNLLSDLTGVSPEILIKFFLHTKDTRWSSVASGVALLQGVGITIVEKTIVVYCNKEPVKVECDDSQIIDQLVNTFAEQAMKFDLPCMCPRKVPVSDSHKEELPLSFDTLPTTSVEREKH